MTSLVSGPSGGVTGHSGGLVPADIVDRHPDAAKAIVQLGMHPRAGHDRDRWPSVDWDAYRARVGIGQGRGPWRIEMVEAASDSVTAWTCEAAGMPFVPGWYTALRHRDRGLVMSDVPAEIAGCLPFLDRAAELHPARVLIAGLGLGIVPAWLLARTPIHRIDIVEIDPDVIALVTGGAEPGALNSWAADRRLHIWQGDAHTWTPRHGRPGPCAIHRRGCGDPGGWWFDAAWYDIWDYVSARNLPSMKRLTKHFARYAGWYLSWERPECEAMLARGQTAEWPDFLSEGEAASAV